MTKGFVTIATGSERYYKMALNLLLSFKVATKNETDIKFALICDKENEYTKKFDKTILLENASFSFMDKIKLTVFPPYDETIFIDADSLIYSSNIINLFKFFESIKCFSAFGTAYALDSNKGWFSKDGAGKFKDKINFLTGLHGGIYFIKKSNILNEFSDLANYIVNNYKSFHFIYPKPCDEAVFALTMSVTNNKPIENQMGNYLVYPGTNKKKKGLKIGKQNNTLSIIHFGNIHTYSPKYLYDSYVVSQHLSHKPIRKLYFLRFCWRIKYSFKLGKFYSKKIANKIVCR